MEPIATFEKVSFEQFLKDAYRLTLNQAEEAAQEETYRAIWESIKLPTRATAGSAGYDFYLPNDTMVAENYDILVPTGIRVKIEPGWMLAMFPRSSLGMKFGMRLKNTAGIIDSDYYNAQNEGHIMVRLCVDYYMYLKAGDRFVQGILLPVGIATNDTVIEQDRVGGMGSTGV